MRNGMTLAVYRVDENGTRLVKPPTLYGSSLPWPFGDEPVDANPPCTCSPGCRYPAPGTSPLATSRLP
ncbi:hypothetical protein EHYA_09029 [Embleya hyalina]|uniref:Uncharacterized protein n=1 Tax=Embleya hyalina TaxID=516124 RepID=A0A401Z2Y9_9ACTN|nr:hypothetical protein EHYA_09029 [Embleya hyalina]